MAEKVELNNKYLFLSDVTFLATFYLCIVCLQILLQRQIKYLWLHKFNTCDKLSAKLLKCLLFFCWQYFKCSIF